MQKVINKNLTMKTRQAKSKNGQPMDYESIISGIFPDAERSIIQEAIRLIKGEKVQNADNRRCMREPDAAEYCGVSKWTMQRWRKAGWRRLGAVSQADQTSFSNNFLLSSPLRTWNTFSVNFSSWYSFRNFNNVFSSMILVRNSHKQKQRSL
jgi:hypothetical protein